MCRRSSVIILFLLFGGLISGGSGLVFAIIDLGGDLCENRQVCLSKLFKRAGNLFCNRIHRFLFFLIVSALLLNNVRATIGKLYDFFGLGEIGRLEVQVVGSAHLKLHVTNCLTIDFHVKDSIFKLLSKLSLQVLNRILGLLDLMMIL